MKTFGGKADGLRLERMRASPLWVAGGERAGFRNVHPIAPSLRDRSGPAPTMTDFFFSKGRRMPRGPLPAIDPRDAWSAPPASGLRATWLGHSTVLVEIDGARVLTDPVWGSRASPFAFVGPKRFQPVPVPLKDIGPLDAVVVSHDHYDHLDAGTIRALARTGVPFITSLGVGAHLEAWGVASDRIVELDWWESHTLPGRGLTFTAAPSQHFSGRSLKDRNATLWSSFVVRSDEHAVFFSGDTGLTPEYRTIGERLGPFDLVMLEVGAFHPSWGDIHLGPDHALDAWTMLGSGVLLPVHWGTFALAMHDWDDPAETLIERASRHAPPLAMPRLGEAFEPSEEREPVAWWLGVDAGREPRPEIVDLSTIAPAGRPID